MNPDLLQPLLLCVTCYLLPCRRAQQQQLEEEVCQVEGVREELRRRLLEVEGELVVQREQMATELDEALRRKDRESQAKIHELSAGVWSQESRDTKKYYNYASTS